MQCQSCGWLIPDEYKYCGNCGTPLQGQRILMKDLVASGIIKAGDKITCSHRQDRVEATVQADGRLEIKGKFYNSPPEAIAAVRGVACDSWHCWKYNDPVEKRERPIHSFKGDLRRKQSAAPKA